jgi:hypothetical protein
MLTLTASKHTDSPIARTDQNETEQQSLNYKGSN